MDKKEFIKSLSKVKLIIGNGFDLHCGLHTKYSDYFLKNSAKYRLISELLEKYEKTKTLDFEDKKVSNLNTWDIFFVINSSKNPQANKDNWCDIERLLLSSLMNETDKNTTLESLLAYMPSIVHWSEIRRHIARNTKATNHIDMFVVEFMKFKMNSQGLYPVDFYQFLLNELKEFEREFGKFIYAQLHVTWFERCNYGQVFLNEPYIRMAMDTIDELCDLNNLVAIDSFNYGDIRDRRISDRLQNINGNIQFPIFGVDSIFEPKDERFIFTKTGRRIDSDCFDSNYEAKPEFENIVIYGHSLNQADYSYFFPVFDRMKLTDNLATNKIIFAYSIYDEEQKQSIKSHYREAVSKLLYAYAIDKKIANPSRFIDSLSTQKRIIMYEIPTLQREPYGETLIDEDWNKIYKKAESSTE